MRLPATLRAALLATSLLVPITASAQIGTAPGVGLAAPSVLAFLQGTCQSHSTITIGTGTFTFVVPAGLGFAAGSFVTAAAGGGSMLGLVQSYAGTNLVIQVVSGNAIGSGSFNCWNFTATVGGDGDAVPNWVGWWGTKGFRNSSIGQLAVNVCVVTSGPCADVHVASDMTLVVADYSSLSCGSNTCVVAKYYDQTGNGHDMILDGTTGAGDGQQFVISSLNGQPTTNYRTAGGTFHKAYFTAALTATQPISMSWVAERTGSSSSRGSPLGAGIEASAPQLGFNSINTTILAAPGPTVTQTGVAEATWHAVSAVANGSGSYLAVDGGSIGPTAAGSQGWAATNACLFGTNSASGHCDNLHFFGNIAQAGLIFGYALTPTDQTNLTNIDRRFWGF